jgi:hypothetical protein
MQQHKLMKPQSVLVTPWRSACGLSGFKQRTGILSRCHPGLLRWRRNMPIALATRQAMPVRDALVRQTLTADLAVVSPRWRELQPEPQVGDAPDGSLLSRVSVEFDAEPHTESTARHVARSCPAL